MTIGQKLRRSGALAGCALAGYVSGIGTMFAAGRPAGRLFASLGVRMMRAGEAPIIHDFNEDDAHLNALIARKVEERVTEEAVRLLPSALPKPAPSYRDMHGVRPGKAKR